MFMVEGEQIDVPVVNWRRTTSHQKKEPLSEAFRTIGSCLQFANIVRCNQY